MKYLNRVVSALGLSILWLLGGCGNLPVSRELNLAGKTVPIFGYSFTAHSTLGMGNYYDYQNGETQSQITLIRFSSSDEADIFMEDRLAQFRSVFEPKRVDYPGQYSKAIECSMELKPAFFEKEIPGGRVAYFDGYAGSNRVAGVCSADLVKYRHLYAVANCPWNNYLLEIEHLTEMTNKNRDDFLSRITCSEESLMGAR